MLTLRASRFVSVHQVDELLLNLVGSALLRERRLLLRLVRVGGALLRERRLFLRLRILELVAGSALPRERGLRLLERRNSRHI